MNSSNDPRAGSIEKYKCVDCDHVGWTSKEKGCRECGSKHLRHTKAETTKSKKPKSKIEKNEDPWWRRKIIRIREEWEDFLHMSKPEQVVTVVIPGLLACMVAFGIYNMNKGHQPSEEEIIGTPEIIVFQEASKSIDKTYFGVVSSRTFSGFLGKDDPFHTEIPRRIWVAKHLKGGSSAHVLIPHNPTELKWKKEHGDIGIFTAHNELIIDNATNDSIRIIADSIQLPMLEANSHAIITFEANKFYQLKITNISSSENETTIPLYVRSGIEFYIYNYKGANSYTIHHMEYKPEK